MRGLALALATAACLGGCGACATNRVELKRVGRQTKGATEPVPPTVPTVPTSRDGTDLIGTKAPGFAGIAWLRGDTVALDALDGKPTVVRWWTARCILCEHSATALQEVAETHGDAVRVVAVFHEKPAGRAFAKQEILDIADRIGMPGTIGWDREWPQLRKWWLDRGGRRFTSITFLLDGTGTIRWIHPGGEYHRPLADADHPQCDADFADLRTAIAALRAE